MCLHSVTIYSLCYLRIGADVLMIITSLLLIGLSVLMHVSWNLMARHVDARCNFLWWGVLAHLLMLGPIGMYGLLQDANWSWPLLAAVVTTMVANSLYFMGLRHAYAQAPATYVYPLARSSPLLIVLWAWLLFDEIPGVQALLGIVISVAGLWWLASSGRHGNARAALPWIALAAFCTSIYSLSDKVAIGYLPSLPAVLGYVSSGYCASFVLLSVLNFRQHGSVIPLCRPPWRYVVPGGLFIGTAYALVIHVMQYLPAAYVVAFTNAGIVLASLFSIFVMREREYWQQRLTGALIISLGLLVLGMGM